MAVRGKMKKKIDATRTLREFTIRLKRVPTWIHFMKLAFKSVVGKQGDSVAVILTGRLLYYTHITIATFATYV